MRADGKRTKNVMPMYAVVPHIMCKRTDSMNMITLDIPLDPLRHYLNSKKKEGVKFSHMGLFIAAYIQTLCEFPALNRFVVNKKIYSRNEISVGMVVLKSGDINDETMSKMYFDLDDTIFTVQQKIDEYVDENRQTGDHNPTDGIINFLVKIPGILGIGVGTLKLMDRFGLLPRAVVDMSPFHESLLISNLASIRTNHIYHHVYEFGTTSLAMTMGNYREVPKKRDGQVVLERSIPVGLVMDERIASGVYFAQAFRRFKELLSHPEMLETPAKKIVTDFPDQYEKSKKRREKLRLKKEMKAKKAEK